jgi:hypothetical protein
MSSYTFEEGISILNEQGLPTFQEALLEGEWEMLWSMTWERN